MSLVLNLPLSLLTVTEWAAWVACPLLGVIAALRLMRTRPALRRGLLPGELEHYDRHLDALGPTDTFIPPLSADGRRASYAAAGRGSGPAPHTPSRMTADDSPLDSIAEDSALDPIDDPAGPKCSIGPASTRGMPRRPRRRWGRYVGPAVVLVLAIEMKGLIFKDATGRSPATAATQPTTRPSTSPTTKAFKPAPVVPATIIPLNVTVDSAPQPDHAPLVAPSPLKTIPPVAKSLPEDHSARPTARARVTPVAPLPQPRDLTAVHRLADSTRSAPPTTAPVDARDIPLEILWPAAEDMPTLLQKLNIRVLAQRQGAIVHEVLLRPGPVLRPPPASLRGYSAQVRFVPNHAIAGVEELGAEIDRLVLVLPDALQDQWQHQRVSAVNAAGGPARVNSLDGEIQTRSDGTLELSIRPSVRP